MPLGLEAHSLNSWTTMKVPYSLSNYFWVGFSRICSIQMCGFFSGLSPLSLPIKTVVKTPPAVQEMQETSLIPELGRSPDGGHDNPFQCSCLEYPTDRGAWRAAVHGRYSPLGDYTAQGLYWRCPERKRESDESFSLLSGSEVRNLVRRSYRNKSHRF